MDHILHDPGQLRNDGPAVKSVSCRNAPINSTFGIQSSQGLGLSVDSRGLDSGFRVQGLKFLGWGGRSFGNFGSQMLPWRSVGVSGPGTTILYVCIYTYINMRTNHCHITGLSGLKP